MDITDKVAVVTGGASGVGRSLCLGLADRGAAAVVVCDIDGAGAAKVAAEDRGRRPSGARVRQRTCRRKPTSRRWWREPRRRSARSTCSSPMPGSSWLAARKPPTRPGTGSGPSTCRATSTLPGPCCPACWPGARATWKSPRRRRGCSLSSGSAPYAVTKHAAVAFAEWLSITYGDQGIQVSCLCPQAFTSNLLATSMRELGAELPPEEGWSGGSAQAAVDGVLTSEQVAGSRAGSGRHRAVPDTPASRCGHLRAAPRRRSGALAARHAADAGAPHRPAVIARPPYR